MASWRASLRAAPRPPIMVHESPSSRVSQVNPRLMISADVGVPYAPSCSRSVVGSSPAISDAPTTFLWKRFEHSGFECRSESIMFTKSGRVFYGKITRVVVRVCVCGSGARVGCEGCLLVRFVCVIRVSVCPVCPLLVCPGSCLLLPAKPHSSITGSKTSGEPGHTRDSDTRTSRTKDSK